MKNRRVLVVVIATLLVMTLASSAWAQGPAGQWTSWPFIQNMEGTEATCMIQFFEEDAAGTAAYHTINNFTIPANSSKLVPVYDTSELGSTFSGSMVVSCDRQVAAVTNVVNDSGAGSSYVGENAGATEVSIPSVHADDWGWFTEISVQNVGSSDATVTVAFTASDRGADYTPSSVVIKPGAVHRFDTYDYAANMDNVSGAEGFVGGATVTSVGSDVVAVAREWNSGDGAMTIAYNGIAAGNGGTEVNFPSQHNNNFGWYAWNFVFNSWDQAANVDIEFTGQPKQTDTIPAGGSITIATQDYLGTADYVGALKVTCTNCPAGTTYLSGITNEVNGSTKGALSYNGFYDGSTGSIIFPSQHNNNWGWNAYNFVQNLDNTQASVRVTWVAAADSPSAAPASVDTTIPANGQLELHTYMYMGGSDFVGSLQVESLSGNRIVAISNEVNANVSGLDASLSRGALPSQ
ncbi:MAG: hypothetical protein ACP5GX_01140 [Anaerolineae bacterium]